MAETFDLTRREKVLLYYTLCPGPKAAKAKPPTEKDQARLAKKVSQLASRHEKLTLLSLLVEHWAAENEKAQRPPAEWAFGLPYGLAHAEGGIKFSVADLPPELVVIVKKFFQVIAE